MKKFLILIVLLAQSAGAPILAQTKSLADSTVLSKPQPPEKYPREINKKAWWERALSFPGDVIFFPLEILFDGIGWTSSRIYDTKLIQRVQDFLTADDGSRGVLPTTAPQAGYGLQYYHAGIPAKYSVLGLQATWGLLRRQSYQVNIKNLPLWGNLYGDFEAQYAFYPDELFYGIGNRISNREETNYGLRKFNIGLGLGFKLTKRMALEVQTDFVTSKAINGRDKSILTITEKYQPSDLPGLKEVVSFVQIQPLFKFNYKNRPGNPNAGWDGLLGSGFFMQTNGDGYGFWKLSADVNRYVHLFKNRVLVLNVGGEMAESLSGKSVPFYYLSQLGETETVRGFERGRYRDKDAVWGTIEYRYPIRTPSLDFLLFADAGQVADDIFEEFSFSHLKPGFGCGLRIWTPKALVTRLELGKSKDGFRFYFILNQDF